MSLPPQTAIAPRRIDWKLHRPTRVPRIFSGGSGLTLMELLVVIAILAVLMALLVPTVSRVKARGERAGCLSNLRQLGTQLVTLIYESDGVLPLASAPVNNQELREQIWHEQIVRRYKLESDPERRHFHCPARETEAGMNTRRPDYGMNYYWGNPDQQRRRVSEVGSPAQTMLLAETEGPKAEARFYVSPGDPGRGMQEAWDERHEEGIHCLYFDGSVSFLTEMWPTDPEDVFWSRPY